MVERVIRTLKEQCVHRHRFETQQHVSPVRAEWVLFYNQRRPHQALGMKPPVMAYALAARPAQKTVGHHMGANADTFLHPAEALLGGIVLWARCFLRP